MAPKSTACTRPENDDRPLLWLAAPQSTSMPPPRSAKTDRATRAALFGLLQSKGLLPRPGPWLSHSRGYVAYLCNAKANSGIDIEWIGERDALALARFAYSPEETRALEALADAERMARFIELWVLKEAAAKALGLDLFTALARCAFEIAGGLIVGRIPAVGTWQASICAPRPECRLGYFALNATGGNACRPAGPSPAVSGIDWDVASNRLRQTSWPITATTGAAD